MMPGPLIATVLGALLLIALPAQASLGVKETQRFASGAGGLGQLPDNAFFGRSAARVADLNGDGHDDLLVGQAYTYQAPGAISVLLLDGNANVISETRLEAGANGVPVEAGTGLGWALAPLGDLDGDGTDDVAAAAPSYGGKLWIFFLNPDGTIKASHGIGAAELPGLAPDARLGRSLGFLGDRDMDGNPELAVGAVDALWILELASDGSVAGYSKILETEAGLGGFLGIGAFANSVAQVGDLDGNGRADLVVGSTVQANYYPNVTGWYGALSVLFLDISDSVTAVSVIGLDNGGFTGAPSSQFGARLAWLENAGCGQSVLAVGEPLQSVAGRVWLLGLDPSGQVVEQHVIGYDEASLGDPDHDYHSSNSAWGHVSAVGDLDGDGVDDLAVGAPEYAFDEGELWLLQLSPTYANPRLVDFGYTFTGDSRDSTVTLVNAGCAPVAGTLSSDSPEFLILGGGGAFSVDPGDSLVVAVSFVPQGGNERAGQLLTDSSFGSVLLQGVGRIATTSCLGHWNLDTFNAANLGPGPENHALWCGVQAGEPRYATPPGFGSHWDEPLAFVAAVAEPFEPSNPVRIRFDYNLDLPLGEFRIERMVGGDWYEVFNRSGTTRDSTGAFTTPAELDLTFDADAVDRVYLDGAPAIALRLRVLTSIYSDQNGFVDTDGAVQIDNLQVWIDGILVSDADFEPEGSDGGWCTEPLFEIPSHINAWHSGFEAPPAGNGLNGQVRAMIVHGGDLVVGGAFTQAGSVAASRVARFDGTSWHTLGEGIADGYVFSLASYEGQLYAGGDFTVAGGSPADHLAVWNGSSWEPAAVTPATTVWTMGVWQDDLYVTDNRYYPSPISFWLQIFDGVQWRSLEAPSSISTITDFQGSLHATTFGGGLYRLDGGVFTLLGEVNNDIYAATVHDDLLVIGGLWNFAPPGGSYGITGWDGSGWVPMPPPPSLGPESLTVFNGRLVAGGSMVPSVMSWENGQERPMGPNVYSGDVFALVPWDGSLWAGGAFSSMGGKASSNIARWTDPGPVAAPGAPSAVPVRVTLGAGRPNPFNPRVTFNYSIPTGGQVRAAVYDLRGRHVVTLVRGFRAAGSHPLAWNGRDGSGRAVASGAYFVRVDHEAGSATRRVVLLK